MVGAVRVRAGVEVIMGTPILGCLTPVPPGGAFRHDLRGTPDAPLFDLVPEAVGTDVMPVVLLGEVGLLDEVGLLVCEKLNEVEAISEEELRSFLVLVE